MRQASLNGLRMTLAGLLLLAGAGAWELSAQNVVISGADDEGGSVYFVGPGHSAYLGVQLEEETEWPEGGARVTSVVDDSPADEAGLRKGDIVVGFDGKTIRGPLALTNAIHDKESGDKVELRIVRDGREKTLEAELVDRSTRYSYAFPTPMKELEFVAPNVDIQDSIERSLAHVYELGSCDDDGDDCSFFGSVGWGNRPTLGVQLADTTPELREHLGSEDGSGVLVSKVLRGTPAEHAGIAVGDLIVRVDDRTIEDLSDLRSALRENVGETFTVEVVRDKQRVDVQVTLPEPDDDEVTGPRAMWRVAPPAPPVPVARVAPVPDPPRAPVARVAPVPDPPRAPVARVAPVPDPPRVPVARVAPVPDPPRAPVVRVAPVPDPPRVPVVRVAPVPDPPRVPVMRVPRPVPAPPAPPVPPRVRRVAPTPPAPPAPPTATRGSV